MIRKLIVIALIALVDWVLTVSGLLNEEGSVVFFFVVIFMWLAATGGE